MKTTRHTTLLLSLLLRVAMATAQTVPAPPSRIIPSAASVLPAGAPAPLEARADAPPPAAGTWQLVRTVPLPNPGPASLDRRGTLYVGDADNNLRQFAADGRPLKGVKDADKIHRFVAAVRAADAQPRQNL